MSSALAEPVTPVPARWTAALAVANLGAWSALFGPIQVLLALQATELVPQHKHAALGLVTGLGAAVALVANPVFGALCDRTTSRFGRRLPWVAGGIVLGAASLVLLAYAGNLAVMAVGWCAAQASFNAVYAALTASVPDQVPRVQRGTVGGWLGTAQNAGVVVGTGVAFVTAGITAGYLVLAVLALVSVLPYLIARRDAVLDRADRMPLRTFLAGFWISPRRYPDFGWAFLTRFAMKLGNAVAVLYLLYYLSDKVHYPHPQEGVFILTIFYAAMVLATAVTAGYLSDRLRMRRPFVLGAGVMLGAAAGVLVVWPRWSGAIVAALVLGVGYGLYTSVDFALLTEVLPGAESRARDLGIINIADSLPQALAPALAAPLVALGGYPLLYTVSAAISIVGGVLVFRIRGVR